MPETQSLIEHLFRHQAGRIVARLTRLLGPQHLDLAEQSAQEAMLRALQTWPQSGVPDNPPAWLFRVAHHAAIDAIRESRMLAEKSQAIVAELARQPVAMPGLTSDDELRMIFMCCHPAISRESQVALSLKIVSGFSVSEIARAFLKDEAAVAQLLVRAKRQIREKKLTLSMPRKADLANRLTPVLDVLYFLFNEGYTAHAGENLVRHDLCAEALRLGLMVASSSWTATPKVHALVALMALQAARLGARVNETGDLILLESQDRGQWDQGLIALGFHHFDRCIAGKEVSEYHLQAAIAATHASGRIDWPAVLDLYDQLLALNPSGVVALNRAVALGKVRGAAEALAAIEPLSQDPKLRDYYLLPAVRGHLLWELGRTGEALASFRIALERSCSEPERRFLQRRIETCEAVNLSARASRSASASGVPT